MMVRRNGGCGGKCGGVIGGLVKVGLVGEKRWRRWRR